MHVPVLSEEAIEWLAIRPGAVYVDATYGRGGHSARILAGLGAVGRLVALDRDPEAGADARQRFGEDMRFEFVHAPFSGLSRIVTERGLGGRVAGLLFDLGVSSPQLDDPGRGFGFSRDGPLDMRMDPEAGKSAAAWINRAGEREIADVIFHYGDEHYSRRIARAIVARRGARAFETTTDLADVIAHAVPRRERRIHPATRSFQAIRIFVNDELGELRAALAASLEVLAPGGRLVVLSFHSLEDRIVKRFMRDMVRTEPVRLQVVARLIRPDADEIATNPRARSARLRVAERPA
ncbi:MAG: 16S rRNA (cytosine(1402)-N(4))-methyltransferase RsmH [Gammaproteobacteria bacterium]